MPVRSLRSSILRWPRAEAVAHAVRRWAAEVGKRRGDVLRIGYMGSYARGDSGVGSDVDLVVVVSRSDQPFGQRATGFDTTSLPVPADVFVYTEEEWHRLSGRLARVLQHETVWVYRAAGKTEP